MPGIEPGLGVCKEKTLPVVLSSVLHNPFAMLWKGQRNGDGLLCLPANIPALSGIGGESGVTGSCASHYGSAPWGPRTPA